MEEEARVAHEDAEEAREDADDARAERDEMAARVKELESKLATHEPDREVARPERPPVAPSVARRRWLAALGIVVSSAILIVGWLVFSRAHARRQAAEAAWHAQVAARNAYQDRWRWLTSVEPCVWQVAYDTMLVRGVAPGKADPREDYVQPMLFERAHTNCLDGAGHLVADPKLPAAAREPLKGWLAIQQQLEAPVSALANYYHHSDWKDDDFANGPALWKPVAGLLERQDRVIADLRRITIPAIDRELREMQKIHDTLHGHDAIWWRVELGLRVRAIVDRAYDAGGIFESRTSNDEVAADAVRPQVIDLLGQVKQAPIELRRILRKVDYVTHPTAAGSSPRGETPFRQLASFDHRLLGAVDSATIPAMPDDPGPRPSGR